MTQDPIMTAMISVGASFLTTILAIVVKEAFERHSRINSMMLGLSIDCAGTIGAFEHGKPTVAFAKSLRNLKSQTSSIESDLELLRGLPSGLVVSPPLPFPRELVNLLPSAHARSIFLYYDSWERYSVLEQRYRALFSEILIGLGKGSADNTARLEYEVLRAERMDQLQALVKDLFETINKIQAYCCEILLLGPTYVDAISVQSVSEFTNGRWNTWQAIRDACKQFHCASPDDSCS